MTNRRQVTMTRVIDGDTVEIETSGGPFRQLQKERVRLYGIDAPETSQSGGKDSTEHLKRLIGSNRKMWMDKVDTDQYGRTVGLIYRRKNRPEDSYNYMMIRDGQAWSYMARSQDRQRFKSAEEVAARHGWGLWKKGNAAAPWDYRQDEKRKAKGTRRLQLILILALAGAFAAAVYLMWLKLDPATLP